MLFTVLIIFTIAIICCSNIYATNENKTGNNSSSILINNITDNDNNSDYSYQAAGENFTGGQIRDAAGEITPNFAIDQISSAAQYVKNYVETNNNLPTNVNINGITINMAQFLELMMTTTLQINTGNSNPIPLRTYNLPTNPIDNIIYGNILKVEYLKIANDLKTYMDQTGKTPDYQYQTSLGTHLGFQNLIYMYSFILYVNKACNYLPNFAPMKPWSSIAGNSAGIIPNGPKFTIDQIKEAANTVKNYIESNNQLPANVNINGITINMAQFLELMMTTTLQINTGNSNPIPLRTYNLPTNPIDNIIYGNILKVEYLKIANDLKTYMDQTGKTPDYQYQTSLGTHLGFQNLIYMYSFILYVNKACNYLPNFAPMKPWSSIAGNSAGIIPNGPKFTIDQIKEAANTVKNYIESNNQLPANVNINGITINMAQFLELMMTTTLQINTGNSNPIPLRTYNLPTNPIDNIIYGNILKVEYLKIANDLKTYMDQTGKTPDYQYQTSLGTHLGFQNLIYMYSKILNFYSSTNYLPNFAEMKPWNYLSSPTLATFSMAQISDAAIRVKNYVETNLEFPNYVTISGNEVKMGPFLEMLMTALVQINTSSNNLIPLKNYSNPSNPIDNIRSGNIGATEYLKIAYDLKNYMDSTGKTPDYQYGTSLGTYLGFQNLVYMYSKILNFYNSASYLPNFAEMKPWMAVIGKYFEVPSNIYPFLLPTINCQVTDSSINSLAWSLALGGNGIKEATKIFEWVRDNIEYSFYYNTKYGAAGTLYWMEGNCVDTSHLLVALCRATGIPARYEHIYAQFSSGNWYGHVIAQVWVNNAWYDADACSYRNTFGNIYNWNTGTATYYGTYASLPF